MAKEQFCLRWNDFERSISNSFRELKEAGDFFDVTLVCEDQQVEAHKVILSACSPFFKTILKKNPHPHPLIYLKDIKFGNLEALLEFMYQGEVKVPQDELGPFLAVAEELRVKGLTQTPQGKRPTSESLQTGPDQTQKHPNLANKPLTGMRDHSEDASQPKEIALIKPEYGEETFSEEPAENKRTPEPGFLQADNMDDRWGEGVGADHQNQMPIAEVDGINVDGINAINRENIENCIRRTEENTYQCVACGKVCSTKTALVNHVENQHYPGHYACTICHAVFKSRGSLNTHHQRHHKSGPFQTSPVGPQRPLMLNSPLNPPQRPLMLNPPLNSPQRPLMLNTTSSHVNIMGSATLQKF